MRRDSRISGSILIPMSVDPDEGIEYNVPRDVVRSTEEKGTRDQGLGNLEKRDRYLVKEHRRMYAVKELSLPENIVWWTCEDVSDWLKFVGFPQYCGSFLENDINGEALLLLEKDDFALLQVHSVGDRILILNAIKKTAKQAGKRPEPALRDFEIQVPVRNRYSVPMLSHLPDSARSQASS